MNYIQFGLIFLILSFSSCSNKTSNMEQKKIQLLINECYINGALNEMKTEEMRRGYHKDFAIFYKNGDELDKLPLEDWIALVKNYKEDKNKIIGLRTFTSEITQIDITEDAAFVKINLVRDNQLVFTDYITLLRFNDNWKIVTKVYHSHIKNPWNL